MILASKALSFDRKSWVCCCEQVHRHRAITYTSSPHSRQNFNNTLEIVAAGARPVSAYLFSKRVRQSKPPYRKEFRSFTNCFRFQVSRVKYSLMHSASLQLQQIDLKASGIYVDAL